MVVRITCAVGLVTTSFPGVSKLVSHSFNSLGADVVKANPLICSANSDFTLFPVEEIPVIKKYLLEILIIVDV